MSNGPTFTYLPPKNENNSDDEEEHDDYYDNSIIGDSDISSDDDSVMSNEDNNIENLLKTTTTGDYSLNNPIFKSNNGNQFINSIGGVGAGNTIDDSDDNDYDEDNDDDEDDDEENYLQKFDEDIRNNIIEEYHPESSIHNYQEVKALCRVVRNADGIIIDDLHKTIPFLTKYEKTCIIGQRAKHINSGAKPFVNVPNNIIDGYLIAQMELTAKKIPFIIRRPIPNGSCEYWYVNDLDVI